MDRARYSARKTERKQKSRAVLVAREPHGKA